MPPFAPSQRVPLPDALAGLCFVLLLLLGLLSNGQAWFAAGFSLPFTGWQDFMAGKPMQQAAQAMAKAALPAGAAQIERGLSWQLAGDLGPRVREGERDWLFLVDELTPHADGARDAAARAQEVIWLNQRLARQGIALLVAVIPDKSRVAAEHLGRLQRPAIFANRVRGDRPERHLGWRAGQAAKPVLANRQPLERSRRRGCRSKNFRTNPATEQRRTVQPGLADDRPGTVTAPR